MFLSGADNRDEFIEKYKKLIAFQTKELYNILKKGKEDGSMRNVKEDCEICVLLLWKNIWGCISQLATMKRMGVYSAEYCRNALDMYVKSWIEVFK